MSSCLLINDDPDQHEAVARLVETAQAPFLVADAAVIEVVFGLERYYKFSRAEIADTIENLMALLEIDRNRKLFERALPLFVKHPRLSFEDCCLATYAELGGAEPLWTFDQKLANQAPNAQLVPR